MIDPKAHRQSKAKITVGRKNSPGKVVTMADPGPAQDRIRERAYELYESRGREPGQAERDWLHAEQEILKHQW
jgi:hypothetical protein